MTGDPPAAAGLTTARPQGAASPAAAPPEPRPPGPRPPGTDPPDTDPPDTGPSDTGPSDTGPSDIGPAAVCASGIGAAEARLLIRTQFRIALGTCAVVLTVVTGLPVLLASVPAVARARVHGLPLWWLVLALGVQPFWIAVSRRQLRRAERAERDLAGPVDGP